MAWDAGRGLLRPRCGGTSANCGYIMENCSDLGHVGRLWTLGALRDVEFDVVTLLQALVALGRNCTVMYEYIGPVFPSDETVSLCVVKPLNGAFQTFHADSSHFHPRRRIRDLA